MLNETFSCFHVAFWHVQHNVTERVHVLIFLQLKAAEEIKIKAAETEKQLQLDLAQIKADQENLDNVTIAEEVSVTKSNSTSDVASQHLSTIQHILWDRRMRIHVYVSNTYTQ